ncbi:MAG: DUF1540 domain-containing protein [Desulfitobacteriaceae bacterium]|nr:DUF1540 domain-containing protein [Desulfitobacteriaceae bacterium]MDI6914358.1 DUF1540 domain-containing protein [Desulfitobacteriaceae bacterium]
MKNPQVQCDVTTCVYNEDAKLCQANAIQITRHHARVENVEGTDCGTFESR